MIDDLDAQLNSCGFDPENIPPDSAPFSANEIMEIVLFNTDLYDPDRIQMDLPSGNASKLSKDCIAKLREARWSKKKSNV